MNPTIKNLIVRTVSGVVFLAIFLFALLTHQLIFGAIFTFVVIVMSVEYLSISIGKKDLLVKVISILSSSLLFLIVFMIYGYGISYKWLMIIPLLLSIIFIALLYQKDKEGSHSYPYLFSSLLYIALPFALINIITFKNGEFNGSIILALMIILWSSDVGAYVFGMLFGQNNGHKLFPSISPKKSWEGYIGGLIMSIIAGYIMFISHLFPFELIHCITLSVIVNVFGTFGDLAESQFKRNFGVKDSGKIMPGHGGLLDRFDGALLAFPASIAYIILLGI